MLSDDIDGALRIAAMDFVRKLRDAGGGTVRFRDLDAFTFEGERVPLIQRPRGIRAVPGLSAALTILTTFRADPTERPYEDVEGADGYLRYKWMRSDPNVRDNTALRAAMTEGKPLVWFFGVGPGEYEPVFPVYVVGEEPTSTQFVVALDEALREQWEIDLSHPVDLALRRQYALALVRQRIHQPVFRRRVLAAYRSECALCRLRHAELLDAAHIKDDSEGGEPIVPNGVSMCAIHHRAFDNNILGIRPDYVVVVRSDVLHERDGPTLEHALQGVHHAKLQLPARRKAWPALELLEERYERFQAAS